MSDRPPSSLPFIIANEVAERFSYYGMKCILVVAMTTAIHSPMPETEAVTWYHFFGTANYLFPLFGALLADIFWGKYRTILILSVVYCLGHLILAVDLSRLGLAFGLGMIALGAGGIKPCVSAHLGDQFTAANASFLARSFAWFYLAINLGGVAATLVTPWLLARYGAHLAFAVPGVAMLLASLVFWLGRKRFRAVAPMGIQRWKRELVGGKAILFRLAALFTIVSIFWALFDQTGSTWVVQATRLERDVDILGLWSFEVLPSQLQSLNPLFVLVLLPLYSRSILPWLEQRCSAAIRISLGILVAAASFLLLMLVEFWLSEGRSVSILWQALAYLPLTVAEILVSVTTLEYAYTQAPRALKSTLTSFYLLSVALGNAVTGTLHWLLLDESGQRSISDAQYFGLYSGLAVLAALLLARTAKFFREETILQS